MEPSSSYPRAGSHDIGHVAFPRFPLQRRPRRIRHRWMLFFPCSPSDPPPPSLWTARWLSLVSDRPIRLRARFLFGSGSSNELVRNVRHLTRIWSKHESTWWKRSSSTQELVLRQEERPASRRKRMALRVACRRMAPAACRMAEQTKGATVGLRDHRIGTRMHVKSGRQVHARRAIARIEKDSKHGRVVAPSLAESSTPRLT